MSEKVPLRQPLELRADDIVNADSMRSDQFRDLHDQNHCDDFNHQTIFHFFGDDVYRGRVVRRAPADAATDNIAACDRLAAHPDDSGKPTDIKESYEIAKANVATALKACKAAGSICYIGDQFADA